MTSKNILVTVNDTPRGDVPIHENLRTALGITAGYKEHKVDILFTGDSVYILHMPEEDRLLRKFLASFLLIDGKLYIDEKSLEERNIDSKSVKEGFQLINREKIHELMKNATFNISF